MDKIFEECRQILLVGEGNFSFSNSLQQKLPTGVKVVATCHESSLPSLHCAKENKKELEKHGATVLFGVDATKLEHHSHLSQLKPFDCIIFQFPHVGGKGNIKKNRNLLKDFFISASKVLSRHGKVLVTLCNGQGGTPADNPQREWNNSWQVVAMATYGGFILTQTIPFDKVKWHLYQSTGYRSQDKSFNIAGAVMHIFHQSQTHPESLAIEKKNEMYSRIRNHQKEAYATITKLFCEILVEHLQQDMDIDVQLNLDDNTPCHEYLKLGTEYAEVYNQEIKEAPINIHQLSSHQCEHKDTSKHISGLVDYLRRVEEIQDYCCTRSLVQNLNIGKGPSVDVKLVHKTCPICPFIHPVMHYAIFTVPKRGTDFKGFQEKVFLSLNQLCFSGNDLEVVKPEENSSNSLEPCDLHKLCEDGQTLNVGDDYEDISFHSKVVKRDISIVPLTCSFFQIGNRMSAVFCLEHIVMNKLKIQDIRVLWSSDDRWWEKFSLFLRRFDKNHDECHIEPFSLYPPSYVHDLSFWESSEKEFDENAFISLVREVTGNNIKELYLVEIYHLGERKSRCYRMIYQSCDRALTNQDARMLQMNLRKSITERLDLNPR